MNERSSSSPGAAPLDARAVAAIPERRDRHRRRRRSRPRPCRRAHPGRPRSATSTRSARTGSAWAKQHATIQRHPTDKNATDTELAVAFAAGMNPLADRHGRRRRRPARPHARRDRRARSAGADEHPARSSAGGAASTSKSCTGPARSRSELATLGATRSAKPDLAAGDARAVHRRHDLRDPMAARTGRARSARRPRSEQRRDRPDIELAISTGILTVFVDPRPPATEPAHEASLATVSVALVATLATRARGCGDDTDMPAATTDDANGDHRRAAATDGTPARP